MRVTPIKGMVITIKTQEVEASLITPKVKVMVVSHTMVRAIISRIKEMTQSIIIRAITTAMSMTHKAITTLAMEKTMMLAMKRTMKRTMKQAMKQAMKKTTKETVARTIAKATNIKALAEVMIMRKILTTTIIVMMLRIRNITAQVGKSH